MTEKTIPRSIMYFGVPCSSVELGAALAHSSGSLCPKPSSDTAEVVLFVFGSWLEPQHVRMAPARTGSFRSPPLPSIPRRC